MTAESNTPSMRLVYADPPYPGCAHLYPEKTEVDHAALIEELCTYDGWALSTNENALRYILSLCPPKVRVLAWCKTDAAPFFQHPYPSWEPVICVPARGKSAPQKVASHLATPKLSGRIVAERPSPGRIVGERPFPGVKPPAFCEWVIRCMGAEPTDTLVELFPGTRSMSKAWERFQTQPPLFTDRVEREPARREKIRRSYGGYATRDLLSEDAG